MDNVAYSKALEKLLIENVKITELNLGKIQVLLDDICEILRIGKIELLTYKSIWDEENGIGESVIYYAKDDSSKEIVYTDRTVSERGIVTKFNFYQKAGDTPLNQEEEEKLCVLASVLHDLNSRIKLTRFAQNAMYYDGDLKIPNMGYFQRALSELVAKNQFENYAVCFFNLKRFAIVNQLLGREQATKVMAQYITQLQHKLQENGTVCRAGGDNFAVLFKKSEADFIVDYLDSTEIVYGEEEDARVVIKTSAGIYMGTKDINSVDDPIEKAHIAMQNARHRLDVNAMFYNAELQQMHEHVSRIEIIFGEAIAREEFVVYYQPKVQLSDYTIAGAEALCRWIHEGDFIRPDDFVPILEQSNAICTLDFYMLEHACKDIRRWLDSNLNVVRVSVNFSRRHLGDERLLDRILEIIDKYEVPHQYIEIELTETTTDVAFYDLKTIVNGLHEHGIHTSVDDFGVGYSSLNLIRQVAWDVIKIDKSFLPDVSDKTSSQYLMFSHLLAMFRELGLKCIVEGVETIEQVKMLKDNKCYLAQGYFFDKPLCVEEFETRLN